MTTITITTTTTTTANITIVILIVTITTTTGFPLMIKAVLGGGGKGMRAVGIGNTSVTESEFIDALDGCRYVLL